MRKLTVFLTLILCLCLATASAAPSRDLRTDTQTDASLATAVSLFAGAALLREVNGLEEGAPVPQALAEGALVLGCSRHLLPNQDGDPTDLTETIADEAAQLTLNSLFAAPVSVPQTPTCPCITRVEGGLKIDHTDIDVESAGSAYIFSVTQENGRLRVLADEYITLAYYVETVDLIPEDSIVWVRTAEMLLEPSAESPLGYRLVSLRHGTDWADGATSEWALTMGEDYEVNLPGSFKQVSSGAGETVYESAETGARLSVRVLNLAAADPLSAQREQYVASHPDARVVMEPSLYYFTGETAGEYVFCVAPENTATVHLLTMTFPAERQYEFSFYGEIIRNSFWCEGLGNG